MKLLNKLSRLAAEIRQIKYDNEQLRFMLGSTQARQLELNRPLRDAEFKVFSQFGEDGLIQYLIRKVPISTERFVEFGVENYTESNTRFLLMHDGWSGLVLDGSDANVRYIREDPMFWRYNLTAVRAFIDAGNINDLIRANGFAGDIGLLSIDIDGNDYWVWQAITAVQPDIVIVEYNALFGPERAITIPYQADFSRFQAHHSGLYFGASLAALIELGTRKGYVLVGCNRAGSNAFFVRQDKANGLPVLTPAEAYREPQYRQGRHPDGTLTFALIAEQRAQLTGLPVINIRTGQTDTL